MQTMQRFFAFFTRKMLTVELIDYYPHIPLIQSFPNVRVLKLIPLIKEREKNNYRFLIGYLVHLFHFENAPIRAGYYIAALT